MSTQALAMFTLAGVCLVMAGASIVSRAVERGLAARSRIDAHVSQQGR